MTATFAIGTTYETRSNVDADTVHRFTVVARTAKFVTFDYLGDTYRVGIKSGPDGEWALPLGSYSLAPVALASRPAKAAGEAIDRKEAMTVTPRTYAAAVRNAARELGEQHAKAAATWIVDGNTKPEAIRATLELIDEGGDYSAYLPRWPNLSGEYADDLTPARLADELGIDPDDAELVELACDAYDDAVGEHFEPACEAELRNAL